MGAHVFWNSEQQAFSERLHLRRLPAYLDFEVGSLFDLLDLLLRGALEAILLLVPLQPPELLLDPPPLLPHLLAVLFVKQRKLASGDAKGTERASGK